jgi:hypothetical protein
MARVLAVHGINNTYSAGPVMAREWVPALLGGVELAGGQGLLSQDDIACVFYGDLFRPPGRVLGEEDLEALEPEDVEDGPETDLLAAWWRAAADVDQSVVPPGESTLGVMSGAQAALAALSGSRFLAGASERLLIFWLKQVRAYFTQPGIRDRIQQRFAAAVTPDVQVVVAHSLGTVVTYEALCAHPEWDITNLVTLGSPLGIRNVILDRLIPPPRRTDGGLTGPRPRSVTAWTNIADRADFVALVKRLRPVFGPPLTDIEINNGVTVHAVARYLTSPDVGAAVAAAVRPDG